MNCVFRLCKKRNYILYQYLNLKMSSSSAIDLRSDTVTRPTPAMFDAMVNSPLGDHVNEEDPTAIKLQERCAKLFGKEDALFVPTGTMGNLISVMAHCESRFQEVIVGDRSHMILYEVAGCAHIAGVQLRTVPSKDDGTFDLEEAAGLIRDGTDVHHPTTALICVENTQNKCGGKVIPLEFLKQVRQLADKNNMKFHMDGARVLNAATYLNVPPSEILQYVDSITLCFSKGLSAPAGSIIAGTKDFIQRSKKICKALGGTMRQIGVLAGPALVGLDTIYPVLHEDHKRAKQIAQALDDNKEGGVVSVELNEVHTNILLIDVVKPKFDAQMLCDRLEQVTDKEVEEIEERISLLMWPSTKSSIRLVVHHDIQAIDKIIKKFHYVLKELAIK